MRDFICYVDSFRSVEDLEKWRKIMEGSYFVGTKK